jgi:hypothetical protein
MEKKYVLYYYYPGEKIYRDVIISAKSFASAYRQAQAYIKKSHANIVMLFESYNGNQIIEALSHE